MNNMTQINAYLSFNGNCREAMNFYKECFGGELTLQTVEGSPMEDQFPETEKKKILHASLKNEDLVLLGSDVAGSGGLVKGNTISLSLNCSSESEIKSFFFAPLFRWTGSASVAQILCRNDGYHNRQI